MDQKRRTRKNVHDVQEDKNEISGDEEIKEGEQRRQTRPEVQYESPGMAHRSQSKGSSFPPWGQNLPITPMQLNIAVGIAVVAFTFYTTMNMNSRMNKFETSIKKLMEYRKYFGEIDDLKEKVIELRSDYNVALRKQDTLNKDIKSEEDRVESINTKMTKIEVSVKNIKSDLDSEAGKFDGLKATAEQALKDLEQGQVQIGETYSKIVQEKMKKIDSSEQSMVKKLSSLDTKIESMTMKQTELEESISIADSNFKSIDNQAQSMNDRITSYEPRTLEITLRLKEAEKSIKKVNDLDEKATQLDVLVKELDASSKKSESSIMNVNERVSGMSGKMDSMDSTLAKYSNELSAAKQQQENLNLNVEKIKTSTSEMEKNISDVQTLIENVKSEASNMSKDIETLKTNITSAKSKLETFTKQYEGLATYIYDHVPQLITDVEKLFKQDVLPWWLSILNMVIVVGVIVYLYNSHTDSDLNYDGYESTEVYNRTPSRHSVYAQQNILDRIHRAPTFENKICIVSFYSETQQLHRMLTISACDLNRKTKAYQVVSIHVRRHEVILDIPPARFIFIFVDFNERDVILEIPGQHLGDKKLVTVQAAIKLGSNVFVTYVRDRGSRTLPPGVLYNSDLSAFNSHFVLKQLTSNNQCFSVYEQFSQSQKEHIASDI